jgi:hypothetical protein
MALVDKIAAAVTETRRLRSRGLGAPGGRDPQALAETAKRYDEALQECEVLLGKAGGLAAKAAVITARSRRTA